jgi:hypothetical protein
MGHQTANFAPFEMITVRALRRNFIAEEPFCIFFAATVTAKMHRQWIDGLSHGPVWKNGDFAAICVRSLTLCGQPQNPTLTISLAPVAGVAKIFQHAEPPRKL